MSLRFLPLPALRLVLPLYRFREEVQYRLIRSGAPALLFGTDLREIPDFFGRAQYVLKTHWTEFLREGTLGYLIREAEREAQRCWAED